jgi:lactoylglutathione lyase
MIAGLGREHRAPRPRLGGEGSAMGPVGVRFELFVDDVERSVAFYGAALGLRPAPDYDPQGYVPVSAGRVRIGLQRCGALPAEHHFRPAHFAGPRGVGVEIVVEVGDVDTVFARARDAAVAHGGQVEPLTARPWGRTDFRLIDPDGYYVRVTSTG